MRRILLIDDEDDIREVAAISLETTAGWLVTTAPSAPEGIRAAASASPRPDAILMDVMMPGMDGPTAFRQMQQTPGIGEIPVILLTAKVSEAERHLFDSLGVAAVLTKPFDPLTLASQIAAALHWPQECLQFPRA